jgi:hypothetical protein
MIEIFQVVCKFYVESTIICVFPAKFFLEFRGPIDNIFVVIVSFKLFITPWISKLNKLFKFALLICELVTV